MAIDIILSVVVTIEELSLYSTLYAKMFDEFIWLDIEKSFNVNLWTSKACLK